MPVTCLIYGEYFNGIRYGDHSDGDGDTSMMTDNPATHQGPLQGLLLHLDCQERGHWQRVTPLTKLKFIVRNFT